MKANPLSFTISLLVLTASGLLFANTAARADAIDPLLVICTEDLISSGCTGPILTSEPVLTVASDGESSFDPFGAGFDTSDGIQLNANWSQAADSAWIQIADTSTWVLPSDLSTFGCGIENETTCEPAGHWVFNGGGWTEGTPLTQYILDAEGGVSDIITLFNDPNGNANIVFQSDPIPTPEPLTLSLFGAGLAGAVAMRRRRRTDHVA